MTSLTNIVNDFKGVVQNGLTHASAVHFYSNYDYLQEVPFQRWWVYTNYDTPIGETSQRWKARGWAFLCLIEGSFRALISAVAMLYNRCVGGVDSELAAKKHKWVLKEQGTGLKYSLWAIWNPNEFKSVVYTARGVYALEPFFGYKKQTKPWGTSYNGTLEIDFCTVNHPWHVKSGQSYPWESQQQ